MNLKYIRKNEGMSQKELALKVGVNQTAVSKWERGDNNPSLEKLIRISEALNCSLEELIK